MSSIFKNKNKNSKILRAKQTSFLAPWLLALGQFSHVVAHRSSSNNTRKIEFTAHFEQIFTMVFIQSQNFDLLGIAIKLVKYIVYLSKRKKIDFLKFSSHMVPK
jgi:hypothetical protein